jgi:hypothetical protein
LGGCAEWRRSCCIEEVHSDAATHNSGDDTHTRENDSWVGADRPAGEAKRECERLEVDPGVASDAENGEPYQGRKRLPRCMVSNASRAFAM